MQIRQTKIHLFSMKDSIRVEGHKWVDWLMAAALFAATAAVVIWQNLRLGILWDLSYVLENSYRISVGDVPYRDFPFPYAPLTFLMQAAIIKLTGRVFWHTTVYCVVVGGLSTVLTWRILLNLLDDSAARRTLALLLTLPLIILGVYCIYPHPFYDPDCTFVVLCAILLLQRNERNGFPLVQTCLAGALLAVPLFVKQNTGLAFLLAVVAAFAMLIVVEALKRRPIRGYLTLLLGAGIALVLAVITIHFEAGLANYHRWTIRFAAARRTPTLSEMVSVYRDRVLLVWIPVFATGMLLLRLNRRGRRWLSLVAGVVMSAPFAWTVVYLLVEKDTSERAERLLAVWPFLLLITACFALLSIRRRSGVSMILPFIVIATIHGSFLSQQVWGSTYALWPLLMLLVASAMTAFLRQEGIAWAIVPATTILALSLLISGGFYVWSHERLDYANLDDGELVRSQLGPLRGLSVRGSWLPDFEELVHYSEKEIPPGDGILMIPGEDLFYYTTGRRPQFPVLMFDRTVNPYSAEEIFELSRATNIRWLIVKDEHQLEQEPLQKEQLLELLKQDFKLIESLNNYDIYRRKMPGAVDDDADEGDDQVDKSQ